MEVQKREENRENKTGRQVLADGEAEQLLRAVERYVKPTTMPIAAKVISSTEECPRPGNLKSPRDRFGHRVAFCQGFSLVRRFGLSLAFDEVSHGCPTAMAMLGYIPPEKLYTGQIACPGYVQTRDAGSNMEKKSPFFSVGDVDEVWMEPLGRGSFRPDVVIVYGNPAQAARLIQAANYDNGEGVVSRAFGRVACSGYLTSPYLKDECSFVVPSGGERIFGICQDDEMIFAVPRSLFSAVSLGLEATHKGGLIRFPTPYFGLTTEPNFPDYYWSILPDEYELK